MPQRTQDHGGDVYLSDPMPVIRDFSASINPLGHPEGLFEALGENWQEILHYPDRRSAGFIAKVAEHYGIDRNHIIAGNGSAELLDLVMRGATPRRVILSEPDFGLYRKFAPSSAKVLSCPRIEQEGFAVDAEKLSRMLEPGDLAIFSNPGNPSGSALPREKALMLAQRALAADVLLVIDEAFCDWCPSRSVLDQAGSNPKLAVIRSMTKFYGIPGIRVGFMAAHPDLLGKIDAIRQPWSVSTLAQHAGIFCLGDDNWAEKSRQYLRRAREKFAAELAALPGFTPLPSEANYLLVRLDPPAPDADVLFEKLKAEGTLTRHCASFGLGSRFVRMAVRTVGENADIIRHLKALHR